MRLIRMFLALLLLAPPAQPGDRAKALPSGDWKAAAQVVSGSCIAVVGSDQVQHKVKLVSWSEQGLTVFARRDQQAVFARDEVLRIGVYKRCNSSRAALYGAVFGFTIGFLATVIFAGGVCADCEDGGTGVVGAVAAGGAVAVASALVASRSSDQPARWIYEKR